MTKIKSFISGARLMFHDDEIVQFLSKLKPILAF